MNKFVAPILLTLVLTGCGGGGGGGGGAGGGGGYLRPDVPFYAPQAINHYNPVVTTTYIAPTTEIFTKDLNNDHSDEVVVSSVAFNGGTTVADYKQSNIQIYGFNTGTFKNETTTWFSGADNRYLGGTTIKFGDFNGDGKIDMFATTFTDSNVTGTMPVFFNTGSNSFTRANINLGDVGAHDSIVTDLNGDGFADIVVTDILNSKPAVAFGSNTGNFTVYRSDNFGGGSGVSVADYMGNGTKTMVLTDAPNNTHAGDDTKLFSWQIVNGKLELTKIADLPADRFMLPKWDAVRASTQLAPHAVRNITMDFNNDGRPDVVVFSTMPKNGNVHGYSEVQFLQNNGGGNFTDVTDAILVNYNTNKTTTYNPQLIDVNNDGLLDILVSATDYTGQASTSVLLATQEGKFVESYSQVFTDFANQTRNMTSGALQNQSITIVAGPGGKRYLMTGVETTGSNGAPQIAVYLSLIGSTGTVTAPASVAVLQQAWPWMSPAQANEALSRSVVSWVNGVPVLDFEAAMRPIGELMLSMNGRDGTRIPITGNLSMPGLNPALLNNVQAVDALHRNFTVNLEGMAPQPLGLPAKYSMIGQDVTQNWSSRFTDQMNYTWNGMDVSGNETPNMAWSITNKTFDLEDQSPWTLRSGMTRVQGNPWISISGMFGTIRQTTLYDFNATYTGHNGMFGQIGVMHSIADYTAGLVEKISPMWLGYAVGGWRDNGFTVYGGIQPTIFDGTATVKLPTSVDSQGTMHYTQHTVSIRNRPVAFAGVEKVWRWAKHAFGLSGVVNDEKAYQTRATYTYKF